MNMTKEQLIAHGLTEEQATAVLRLHSEAIDGAYIPKHRFNEVNTELGAVKKQLGERDNQIKELEKFEGDAKQLSEKLKELETVNKQTTEKYQQELISERKRNAVKLQLLSDEAGKPHDAEMVMSLINLEQVTIDENGKIVSGFKEQHDSLKKDKAFLFDAKQEPQAQPGWKPVGKEPPEGVKNPIKPDEVVNFGKSLAKQRLGMMGATVTEQN